MNSPSLYNMFFDEGGPINSSASVFCDKRATIFFISSLISQHHDDVIMSKMKSQITSLMIVYSSVYSGADQRKHQSSASLAFVREIHRGPVISPHKGPVTWKIFPFDDVFMFRSFQLHSELMPPTRL